MLPRSGNGFHYIFLLLIVLNNLWIESEHIVDIELGERK